MGALRKLSHQSAADIHVDVSARSGLTLAAGRVLGGRPWFGVWASVPDVRAIVWMLQAWLPPVGPVWRVDRRDSYSAFSYWIEGYWGGYIAADGRGADSWRLPRLMRPWDAGCLSWDLGLRSLLTAVRSRACAGGSRSPVYWLYGFSKAGGGSPYLPRDSARFAAWRGMLYNWRVTGYPLVLPYTPRTGRNTR